MGKEAEEQKREASEAAAAAEEEAADAAASEAAESENDGASEGDVKDKHGQPGINKERHDKEIAEKDAKIAELQAQIDEASFDYQSECHCTKTTSTCLAYTHRFDYQSECHCTKTEGWKQVSLT